MPENPRGTDNIIERAFQLARSGDCRNLGEIQQALSREQFTQIQAHLGGRAIKAQLLKLIAKAEAPIPPGLP